MKQKLAVARVLLHRPALVFLDEPTAGLDPLAAAALRDDLGSLAQQAGVTVFLTTHNLAEAERLCQQVAVIRQGKLLAIGTLEALRRNGRAPQVEITGRGFSDQVLGLLKARPEVAEVSLDHNHLTLILKEVTETPWLVGLLVGAGVQVEEVRKSQASLEEVFLTLMEEEKA
jgi:ABC-2 type transport system ATP-binding protein